jgi:hypothetical protein
MRKPVRPASTGHGTTTTGLFMDVEGARDDLDLLALLAHAHVGSGLIPREHRGGRRRGGSGKAGGTAAGGEEDGCDFE